MFKDKAALVTGASRGLGAALFTALARGGAAVVGVARDGEALQALAGRLSGEGCNVHALVADLSEKEAIYRVSGAAAAMVGPIGLLIHNASTLGATPLRPLGETHCEDFEAVLQLNLLAPFRLSKALIGAMALRGEGTVVHISSDAAVEAYPGWGAYGVSKAALDHLNRSWAAEHPELRFYSVDPGEMDTAMHAAAAPDADRSLLLRPEAVAERILLHLRAGHPSGSRFSASTPLPGEGLPGEGLPEEGVHGEAR